MANQLISRLRQLIRAVSSYFVRSFLLTVGCRFVIIVMSGELSHNSEDMHQEGAGGNSWRRCALVIYPLHDWTCSCSTRSEYFCYLPMYLIWILQGYRRFLSMGWLSRSSSLQSGPEWVDFAWVDERSAWGMLDVLFASLFKSISRYLMPFSSNCLLRKDPPFVTRSHPLQRWRLCGRKWKLGIQILSCHRCWPRKLSDYVHRTLEVPAYVLSMGMHIFHLPYLTDIFHSYQSAHEIRMVSSIPANRIRRSPKYICWCSKHDLSLLISFSHAFYRSRSTAIVKVIPM